MTRALASAAAMFTGASGNTLAGDVYGEQGAPVLLLHGGGQTRHAWKKTGELIARMGRTGNATGVNLHYEVSLYGLRLDPLRYGLPPADPTTVQPSEPTQPAAIAYSASGRAPG